MAVAPAARRPRLVAAVAAARAALSLLLLLRGCVEEEGGGPAVACHWCEGAGGSPGLDADSVRWVVSSGHVGVVRWPAVAHSSGVLLAPDAMRRGGAAPSCRC